MKIPEQIHRLPRFAELLPRLESLRPGRRGNVFGVEVPLRVCPLGAHVDHQGGVVTGMAIDRSVKMAASVTDEAVARIESVNFPGRVEVALDRVPERGTGGWGQYVRAAVAVLQSKGRLTNGLDAVVHGEMIGAGLSSSAAVLIAYLVGLAEANGIILTRRELAASVQEAENSFIGVSSGLLDQSVMINAEPGKLTRIDCGDQSIDQIDSPPNLMAPSIVVAFTGSARSLADSGYNLRVTECRDAAAQLLQMRGDDVPPRPRLCDVEPEVFAAEGHRLPPHLRRRATHYFTEIQRVAEGCDAWRRGDLARFGGAVNASGESSMVNYECGTPVLATMLYLLREREGIYGTRFSGGGFGGTCIAFADPDAAAEIIAEVAAEFAAAHPTSAANAAFQVCASAGSFRVFRSAP